MQLNGSSSGTEKSCRLIEGAEGRNTMQLYKPGPLEGRGDGDGNKRGVGWAGSAVAGGNKGGRGGELT